MKHNFKEFPKQISISDYNNVRDEIVQFYKDNNDVISIYEYGSVSSPGVSDLDLIFILKDSVCSNETVFDFSSIDSFSYNLVDGAIIKMPLEVFQRVQYFDHFNLRKLSGEDLSIVQPTKLEDKYIKLASIIDWVPERILKLTGILNSKDINITSTLCILYSLCYSLKYLDNILDISDDSRELIREISRLRDEWHKIDDPNNELIECLHKAIDIGFRRLFDYEKYLRSSNDYLMQDFNCEHDIDLELYPNHFIRFSSCRDEDYKNSLKGISSNNKHFVMVSNYYYPHFAILASQKGKLSRCMLGKVTPPHSIEDFVVNNLYKNNLIRKISLAEINATFLRKNNLKTGLIRYGFHF